MARKILLTWYGIADLRAAFGFEVCGPILRALQAERYDDVIILGYSDDVKQTQLATFDDMVLTDALAQSGKVCTKTDEIVSRFSNTRQAHKHFCEWLKYRLSQMQSPVRLIFRPIHLKKLNDTNGIYDAAFEALRTVDAQYKTCELSLFLTPGTPVMAFVWAFAALNFPHLRKRLLSASMPGFPPEAIALPREWQEWYGIQAATSTPDKRSFGVLFHLFGEQRLPLYRGLLQYTAKWHVFVTSEEYTPEVLRPFLNSEKAFVLHVNAFDPEDVRKKILKFLTHHKISKSVQVGFNLTGGTKMMYAGAFAACRKINGFPFYFNLQNNCVINLLTFEKKKIGLIDSVDTFLKLHLSGTKIEISNSGKWENIPDINIVGRRELMHFLWEKRSEIARIYKPIATQIDSVKKSRGKPGVDEGRCAFDYRNKSKAPTIEIYSGWDDTAGFRFFGVEYTFEHFPYFAKYITGGWFEEYVYTQLKSLEDEGLIFDLRIGLILSYDSGREPNHSINHWNGKMDYQEFDILFTDGCRLYVVECKAGKATSDHAVKLINATHIYGGIGGIGILLCCFNPLDVVWKRIDNSSNCRIVVGEDIRAKIREIVEANKQAYL